MDSPEKKNGDTQTVGSHLSLINGFTPAQTCTEETELTAHGTTSLLVQEHHFHHPKAWAYCSKPNSTECHDTSNFSHREQPTTGEIGVQLLATHIMACCAGAVIIPIPLSGDRDSILIETWLYTILSVPPYNLPPSRVHGWRIILESGMMLNPHFQHTLHI